LNSALGGDTEAEILSWLMDALEHAHARGQTKLVGFLEAVVEEVVGNYDARKTLEAFSVPLRSGTDLEALSDDLVGVVRETMHFPTSEQARSRKFNFELATAPA
jgi:hypothetical protein